MADSRVYDVSVHVPETLVGGSFANAFRIVPDCETYLFLDFCSYSEAEKRGVVVARVRVHSSFLSYIRDRLTTTLIELVENVAPPPGLVVRGPGEGNPS